MRASGAQASLQGGSKRTDKVRTHERRAAGLRNARLKNARLRNARLSTQERTTARTTSGTRLERACAARARVCVGSPGETLERTKRTPFSSGPVLHNILCPRRVGKCENRAADPSTHTASARSYGGGKLARRTTRAGCDRPTQISTQIAYLLPQCVARRYTSRHCRCRADTRWATRSSS